MVSHSSLAKSFQGLCVHYSSSKNAKSTDTLLPHLTWDEFSGFELVLGSDGKQSYPLGLDSDIYIEAATCL